MKIFIAGGSGTIGIPLVRALIAAGHQVTALTRSKSKIDNLRDLGASAAVADALNPEALSIAVRAAQPTHVIHQLTALPANGPRRPRDLEATNRLRIEGTRNLLEAAVAVGAKRFLVGSFALLAPRGPVPAGREEAAAAAIRSMETQVLEASTKRLIEGIILRYGMFYSRETPSTVAMIDLIRKRWLPMVKGDAGQLPVIHVEDAVSATLRALDIAPPGSIYEIVDDQAVSMSQIVDAIAEFTGSAKPVRVPGWLPRLLAPYMARLISVRLPLSNYKAKTELGLQLRYPTMRSGLAQLFREVA